MAMEMALPDDKQMSMSMASSGRYDFDESIHDIASSHTAFKSDTSASNSSVHDENKTIDRSKRIVYLCLLATCLVTTAATFFFVRKHEQDTFKAEFIDLANEIIDIAEENAANKMGQVHTLSVTLSSWAEHLHASEDETTVWPNVTLPHFTERLHEAMVLTHAELIATVPIVHPDQKVPFEHYAHEESVRLGLIPATDLPHRIHSVDGHDASITKLGFHAPLWQVAPPPRDADIILLDWNTFPWFQQVEADVIETHHAIMSGIVDIEFLLKATRPETEEVEFHPRSVILKHIPKEIKESELIEDPVGFVVAVLPWESYFTNALPHDVDGFLVEVNDHCGTVFSYEINGHYATLRGRGGLHDTKYNYLHQEADFAKFAQYDGKDTNALAHCHYTLDVYPTTVLEEQHTSSTPYLLSAAVFGVFLFTMGAFYCYDLLIQRRQDKVSKLAKRTTHIVNSLFPKQVQERIMEEVKVSVKPEETGVAMRRLTTFSRNAKDRVKAALKDGAYHDKLTTKSEQLRKSPPIAELFPSVTVMFGDLVGFTAWSSMREPTQVFELLETIYCEFDGLAKKRRIFKVETIGDCYVAACGLPDPRRDHAVAMARFARDCRSQMIHLTSKLEMQLGPDTAELGIRIGLHSGPVTGGVLRGDKARFQLFGDTMNTTARVETTGKKNMVHLSEETAHLIHQLGKGHWVRPREDTVVAKGKGELVTYWLVAQGGTRSTSASDESSHGDQFPPESSALNVDDDQSQDLVDRLLPDNIMRLVHWNADVLSRALKEVMQRRQALEVVPDFERVREFEMVVRSTTLVLDEVTEVIALPRFNVEAARRQAALPPVELGEEVMAQLSLYIQSVASLYRENPFHNFEHVSHVIMSVTKLMSRIVAPDLKKRSDRILHDHTYGITSDPLTQFAVIFAALIHDVDHQGVSNAVLVAENSSLAACYRNKSVAEQNSIDIAWNMLMDDSFLELRNCIYTTPEEYHRFRQLVVNLVMATDIVDKELSTARKERWARTFAEAAPQATPSSVSNDESFLMVNQKATIVLEHLIQASDIAHTMQHWHVYRKWNTRLFQEMRDAYKAGRLAKDPADSWFEGEIGFFDFYIIPLAKKLKDCGVFGVSSDEYLNYALKNRKEWHAKGKEIVAEMIHETDT